MKGLYPMFFQILQLRLTTRLASLKVGVKPVQSSLAFAIE